MKLRLATLGLCLGFVSNAAFSAGDTAKGTDTKSTNAQAEQKPVVLAEVWTVYIDRLEREAVSVNFPKGSAELSADQQSQVKQMAQSLLNAKDVDKVIVAAWSDEAYPAQEGARLPDAARQLAEKRAAAVEDLIEKAGIHDVDTYSMAEKPNWFQKAFATDAAQIKGAAENKQLDSLNEDRIRKFIESKGGPSKAVIMVKREMSPRAS